MEAIVGILIIAVIIYTLNKVCASSSKKVLPHVEIDDEIETVEHKSMQQSSDRLDVVPDLVVNKRKKKARRKQCYSATYLKQGIIMKEILDAPRAKSPLRKRRIYS